MKLNWTHLKVAIFALCLLFNLNLSAQTQTYAYTNYVDFDGGSDSNSGLSTNAPWRTLPGTYNPANNAFKQSAWGTNTTSGKIPLDTLILIKCGTTYSVADGGSTVVINPSYYTGSNGQGRSRIKIMPMLGWGSGPVVFDGAGMTIGVGAEGIIYPQLDSVEIAGIPGVVDLIIQNSPRDGIHWKEKSGTSYALTNCTMNGITFIGSGTSFTNDASGSGAGQCNVRKAVGLWVLNCKAYGSNQWINGFLFGDSNFLQVKDGSVVSNCVARGHRGDESGNDSGIGFKALNSSIEFKNCVSENNLKGFDLGELNHPTGFSSRYLILNSLINSNIWGINHNWSGIAGQSDYLESFVVNNIITSNRLQGCLSYAAGLRIRLVHNNFAFNGDSAYSSYSGNFNVQFDAASDTNNAGIGFVAVNNAIIWGGGQAYGVNRWNPTNQNMSLEIDNNFVVQGPTDGGTYARIGYFNSGADINYTVGWGAPWSPGNPAGWWATFYTKTNATPPAGGTGHFGADANSTVVLAGNARNAVDQIFSSLTTYDLKNKINGQNLTAKSWYIPEMSYARDGALRNYWSVGAYDSAPTTWVAPPPPAYVGFTNSTPITLSTGSAAVGSPYPSTITVSGLTASEITNLIVTLKVTHTYPRDIDGLLVAPDGTNALKVLSDSGDGSPVSNIILRFSDYASGTSANAGAPLSAGTFKPTDISDGADTYSAPAPASPYKTTIAELLANGVNGDWKLYLVDDGNGDGGNVEWSLQFEKAQPSEMWIAPDGNNGNSGSEDFPKTWNWLPGKTFVGGSTIWVKGGNYGSGVVGTIGAGGTNSLDLSGITITGTDPLYIRAWRGAIPIVNLTSINTPTAANTSNNGNIIIEGIAFSDPFKSAIGGNDSQYKEFFIGGGGSTRSKMEVRNCIFVNHRQVLGNVPRAGIGNIFYACGTTNFDHQVYWSTAATAPAYLEFSHNLTAHSAGAMAKAAFDAGRVKMLNNIAIAPGTASRKPVPGNAGDSDEIVEFGGENAAVPADITFDDNLILGQLDSIRSLSMIRISNTADGTSTGIRIRRNKIFGYANLLTMNTASDSHIYGSDCWIASNWFGRPQGVNKYFITQKSSTTNASGVTWNGNTYWQLPWGGGSVQTELINYPDSLNYNLLSSFQGATAYEVSGLVTNGNPGVYVQVVPNPYTSGRAHIGVINLQSNATVQVDLSGIGLTHGQRYIMFAGHNPLGNWVTNEFDQFKPVISLSMNPADWPLGTFSTWGKSATLTNQLPGFGAFAVIPAPVDRTTSITVQPSSTFEQVFIRWTQPSGSGWEKLVVERSVNNAPWEQIGQVPYTATTFTDLTPAYNANIKYRVRAANSFVSGTPSEVGYCFNGKCY